MNLLSQVAGVLLAALVIAGASGSLTRRAFARSAALVAAVVTSVLGVSTLWPTARTLSAARDKVADMPLVQRGLAGPSGTRLDFVEWTRGRIGPRSDERFLVLPERLRRQGVDPGSYIWLNWRLLPALATAKATDADWVVFYDVAPTALRPPTGFGPVQRFAPGFGIAERLR